MKMKRLLNLLEPEASLPKQLNNCYQDTMMRCVQTTMGCVKTALHAFALGVIPCIAPSLGPHCTQASITVESLQHPDTIPSIYPALISSQMVSLSSWSCASTGQRRHGRADAQTCSPCGCMAVKATPRPLCTQHQPINLFCWQGFGFFHTFFVYLEYIYYRVYEQYKLQVTTTISTKPRLTQKCEEFIASRLVCPFCKRPASRQTQIPYQWTALWNWNIMYTDLNII